jgi:glycosyltransferase involved in cell wall biosynthesis
MMLTSVLMPMRNAAPYVKSAIESVLAHQSSPLELVVMDDGSTDDSAAIVRSIIDKRVRLYPGPQAGISACLNAAWAHCSGDVVMRCDADDLFTPARPS